MAKVIIPRANPEYFRARYYTEDDEVLMDDTLRVVGVRHTDGTVEMYPPPFLLEEVEE